VNRYNIKLNDKSYDVLVRECKDDQAMLDINGIRYLIDRSTAPAPVSTGMEMANFQRVNTIGAEAQPVPVSPGLTLEGEVQESVTSPLPGSVLEILCKEGASVSAGDVLIKLEAMKMETEIQTQTGGTIKTVKVNIGDAVQQGQVLVEII
jgi:biotin carboxyl carrier protein